MAKQPYSIRRRGFSLIEVLISVVVLSTGLLALAALQGSLVRNAADARTRSQVAAVVEQVVETMRTNYDSIATDADVAGITSPPGVSNLSIAVTSTEFDGRSGSFVTYDAASSPPLQPLDPQYKRVTIAATWTDSGGAARTLDFDTVLSPRTSGQDSSTPFRTVSDGSDGALTLTKRASQEDVIQEGMIPIAVGDAQSAASNPKPKVFSTDGNDTRVATTFDILTYRPDGGDVIIRRRIENQVISCDCQYGSSDGTAARWPAVWDGMAYSIYQPSDGAAAPGAAVQSTSAHDGQSPLCTRCCRDHHDDESEGVAKFDPEAATHAHYNKAGVLVDPNSAGTYVESCRMVRIDGLWQTAADMYSRHFGLLKTASNATTGVPDDVAVTAYQDFVKDYLEGYAAYGDDSGGTAPSGAGDLFNDDARGLNAPTSITINKAPPRDQRYLHARGLYVDFLGPTALEKLLSVVENCPAGTDDVECLLPYLPFTTINVTELAFWAAKQLASNADASSILSVSTGSSQIYDPAEPTRGRVNATGGNGNQADAESSMTQSNSGVAVVLDGIDPIDAVASKDRQKFQVGTNSGNPDGIGEAFFVQLVGLPQLTDGITNNDPAVAWRVGNEVGDCVESLGGGDTNPNDYVCTTSGPLGVAGQVTLAEYYRVREEQKTVTASCLNNQDVAITATASVMVPVFYDYEVEAVSHSGSATVSSDSRLAEQTAVGLAAIAKDDVISVTFTADSPSTINAQVASCRTNGGGNKIENIVWCKPWEQTCGL